MLAWRLGAGIVLPAVLWACAGENVQDAPADAGAQGGAGGHSANTGPSTTSAGGAGEGGASTGGSGSGTHDIRVLTLNLLNFITGGDASTRTEMVIDAIDTLQPDFVALQEVAQTTDTPNRAEVIAAATGYSWDWAIAHDVFVYQEGTAFMSRWPVLWTESIELPHGDFGGATKRVTIGAGLELPVVGTPHFPGPYVEVAFFSSHATLDSNEDVQADQALASWELLQAHASGLAFLAGDMNVEPDALAMRFLRGEASHDGQTGDLIDSWLTVNPTDDGFSIPSDGPERRIDYVYALPQPGLAVIGCELVLTDPVDGVYASDHLGVMCDYQLL